MTAWVGTPVYRTSGGYRGEGCVTLKAGAVAASLTATAQARMGFYLYLDPGAGDSGETQFCALASGATVVIQATLDISTHVLNLYAGNGVNLLGTRDLVALSLAHGVNYTLPRAQWFYVALDVYLHALAGWASLWVAGNPCIYFPGDTTASGATLDTAILGPAVVPNNLPTLTYADNWHVDDATGETLAAPNPVCFTPRLPNGDSAVEWTGSDGNQVDNFHLVHDDDDDTYVHNSVAAADHYTLPDYTSPDGWDLPAVLVASRAKRPALSTGTYRHFTENGGVETLSAALTPGATFAWSVDRRAPGGGYSEATLDAMLLGLRAP